MKLQFKIFLVLLLMFAGSGVFAQTEEKVSEEKNSVDSLLYEIQRPKTNNAAKALLYEHIAFTYNSNRHYDTAKDYFSKASTLYEQLGDKGSAWRMTELEKQMDRAIADDSNKKLVIGAIAVEVFVFLIVIALLVKRGKKQRHSNQALLGEKKKSEELLLNILPETVAREIQEKGITMARQFDNVTVIFTDFVSFTKVAERFSPTQLVGEMHACFKAFDEILEKCKIEKIKTVGDAYLSVAGLPTADKDHAVNAITFALHMRNFMLHRKFQMGDATFEMRIGAHSGSVIAGIVGVKKFAYDIWGDTVNTAARMEQNSEPGKITISETTYELIKDKFVCEYRGEIDAKNKGKMKMYFVLGPKDGSNPDNEKKTASLSRRSY